MGLRGAQAPLARRTDPSNDRFIWMAWSIDLEVADQRRTAAPQSP
jgi:hypothetical protein